MQKPEMTAGAAVDLLQLFSAHDIAVHVDGGWGVDALLGEQTRPHDDLDIAMQHRDVPKLRALLAGHGFREIPRDDSWACNFVLADDTGRQVDVHSYEFDEQGKLRFGVPYPAESLTGHGKIGDLPVACIAPAWLVEFHTGYELDWNDYRDVAALCIRFGLVMPPEFARFQEEDSRSQD
jgi:lincosamide nucleotidyltransferase A/C/D/E